MTIYDIAKESWLSIGGNKMRSFLTVLGIVIGVMAVVIMVAVGETVEKQVTDQFSSLGTNTIMIRAGAAQSAGVRGGNRNTLTMEDAQYIGQLPDVAAVTPVQNGSAQVVFGNKNWATSLVGCYPDYATVQNIEMAYGTFFDSSSVRNASTHAVIGPETATELGLPDDPVGQVIRIQSTPFTIIGVTRAKGDSTMGSQDDMIIIPITTLKKRLSGSRFYNSVQMISLKLYQDADNNIVTDQITALLRQRHNLKDSDADDFQVTDMKQVMETMETVTGYLKMLLVAIAAVSLLVGSIGIMNMMLVSVAERTREIGIRKAIGAQEKVIIIQFLSESILISFMGSMVGLLLGIGLSQGVGRILLNYNVPFSIWPVVVSVTVAVVVGLVSGVVPAIKASKLNPIDSLRYE
ncbi:MAG: ABC transporter permease [Alphaproteobacteria bacterium]|nr:ABC transporter permease [Alphaproteobacteria bacterium]MDE6571462.1 ABC transporter permease [Alphaproteobacteria bacterium]